MVLSAPPRCLLPGPLSPCGRAFFCSSAISSESLHKDAAWRHKKHIPPRLKAKLTANVLAPGADLDKLRLEESEGLLAHLASQRARLLLAQDMAVEAEQLHLVVSTAGQIHRNLELVGKYLGEFAQHHVTTQISILVSPEYLQLRAALLRAASGGPARRGGCSASD
jgi:hypothetical protein